CAGVDRREPEGFWAGRRPADGVDERPDDVPVLAPRRSADHVDATPAGHPWGKPVEAPPLAGGRGGEDRGARPAEPGEGEPGTPRAGAQGRVSHVVEAHAPAPPGAGEAVDPR